MAKKTPTAKKAKVVKNPFRQGAKASPPARSKAQSNARSKARSVDRSSKRKRHTSERKRGGQFARHLQVLAAIHKHHGGKPFNKKMLADWLLDDLDRALDDLSVWYEASVAARGVASAAPPASLETIQEASRDRNAERAVKSLQKFGILITRTDENGKPYREKPAKVADKKGSKKATKKTDAKPGGALPKVWWTYDPTGPISTDLQRLFTNYKLTSYQLEGIMGCTALLKNLYGLPMEERVRSFFRLIESHVSPQQRREAAEHAAVWRYLFRRPGKYEPQKKLLQHWNDATILRQQCSMQYAKADVSWLYHLDSDGQPALPMKRVAAFGTVLVPEEDSLYLVGCEADKRKPGKWLHPMLYKFDRVMDLRIEDDENPPLADVRAHSRISELEGMPNLLDLERLFTDSIGAFFHYGQTDTLVVRVHDPEQIALVLERPFHRQQHFVIGPGKDEITLTVDSCFLDEVLPRLLAMKDGFTVEQPPELAQAIHHMANDMASRHSPGPQAGSRKP